MNTAIDYEPSIWSQVWTRVARWLTEPIDFPGKTWYSETSDGR
ncbi:MAG: hypothetical protein AB7G28_17660 [Pirellulales bacterium]